MEEIDENWWKLGEIRESWGKLEKLEKLQKLEKLIKLDEIDENWSKLICESWRKLMKIDENWKSCENWKNGRGRKIEWNCMKLRKLEEIAEIGFSLSTPYKIDKFKLDQIG